MVAGSEVYEKVTMGRRGVKISEPSWENRNAYFRKFRLRLNGERYDGIRRAIVEQKKRWWRRRDNQGLMERRRDNVTEVVASER